MPFRKRSLKKLLIELRELTPKIRKRVINGAIRLDRGLQLHTLIDYLVKTEPDHFKERYQAENFTECHASLIEEVQHNLVEIILNGLRR